MFDVKITWSGGAVDELRVQRYRSFDSGLIELTDAEGGIAYLSPHHYTVVAITNSELGENSE